MEFSFACLTSFFPIGKMFKFRDGFLLVFLLEKGSNSEMGYLEIYGWGQRMG